MKELKATDLRIGNYVTHCDYTDGIFKVESITYQEDAVGGYVIDTIGGKNGTWGNPINCIEPIELTEEWLLGFGFTRDSYADFRWYLLDKSITYDTDDNCIRIADSWEFGKRKYVHELQNLYFALTGQELKVKF